MCNPSSRFKVSPILRLHIVSSYDPEYVIEDDLTIERE